MCDCISVTYQLIGEEPVTVEVESSGILNGKPIYQVNLGDIYGTQLLYWLTDRWILDVIASVQLESMSDCPFGNYAILNIEGSTFESFVVSECTPPRKTITYSKIAEGWNSFWSFSPDWMTEMNSIFYTFKNGELWRHNVNTTRNNFYGNQYPSSIRTIFNTDPLMVKMFNTVSLNSTHPWTANVYTNINDGSIDYTYFVEKEAQWYAYIRRFDNTIDVKALSTQGVGSADSVDSTTPSAVVLDFLFKLDSSISIGDKLYKNSAGTLVLVGTITDLSSNSITVDTTLGSIPLTTDFLICVKNSQAESFGARGYYMNIYLENDLTEQVKLFAVGTSVFKSFL
jgi:hypothetical protein